MKKASMVTLSQIEVTARLLKGLNGLLKLDIKHMSVEHLTELLYEIKNSAASQEQFLRLDCLVKH